MSSWERARSCALVARSGAPPPISVLYLGGDCRLIGLKTPRGERRARGSKAIAHRYGAARPATAHHSEQRLRRRRHRAAGGAPHRKQKEQEMLSMVLAALHRRCPVPLLPPAGARLSDEDSSSSFFSSSFSSWPAHAERARPAADARVAAARTSRAAPRTRRRRRRPCAGDAGRCARARSAASTSRHFCRPPARRRPTAVVARDCSSRSTRTSFSRLATSVAVWSRRAEPSGLSR